MNKSIAFRFLVDPEKDKDLYDRLINVPRPVRGDFIRWALKTAIAANPILNNQSPQEVPVKPISAVSAEKHVASVANESDISKGCLDFSKVEI